MANQRKIWQNRICATLRRKGKGSLLNERLKKREERESPVQDTVESMESSTVEWRGRVEQPREEEGGSSTGRVLQRQIEKKNKLDTGKDRTSQRMRRSQKIRKDC